MQSNLSNFMAVRKGGGNPSSGVDGKQTKAIEARGMDMLRQLGEMNTREDALLEEQPSRPKRRRQQSSETNMINSSRKSGSSSSSSSDGHKTDVSYADVFNCVWSVPDLISGQLELPALIRCLIDTPHFQRLRKLRQLGVCHLVWPSATHSRFEHSIGVCFMAGKWVKNLMTRQPELGITPSDVLCVQVAGLCHDLGHGPMSHVFDGMILPALGAGDWSHEDGSTMMFDALLRDNNIDLAKFGLDPVRDVATVKEMILGVPAEVRAARDAGKDGAKWPRKRFLFDIVNNQESGLDVDKLDYFRRDVFNTGADGNKCNFEPLTGQSRVMRCPDGQQRICFPSELYKTAFWAFQTRYQLHEAVYTHATVKAVELMVCDLVVALDREGGFRFRGLPLSEVVRHADKYVALNDSLLDLLSAFVYNMAPDNPVRAKALDLHSRMDGRRRLYKYLGWVHKPKHCTAENKDELAAQICAYGSGDGEDDVDMGDGGGGENGSGGLSPQDIVVEFQQMHYGKKDKNPLDFMYFFPPTRVHTTSAFSQTACAVPGDECSAKLKCHTWLPPTFLDERVRVFCRMDSKFEAAKKAFAAWIVAHSEGDQEPLIHSQQDSDDDSNL